MTDPLDDSGLRVVLACLRAAQNWTRETGRPPNAVFLRVVLYDYWERPRLRDRQAFSRDYLWSQGARRLYASRAGLRGRTRTTGLRRDHALPLKTLWNGLLSDDLGESSVKETLTNAIDVRVLTEGEHVRLGTFQRSHPPSLEDTWTAYELAGLGRATLRHRDDLTDLTENGLSTNTD